MYANQHTCLASITSYVSSYTFHLSALHSLHPTTVWRKMLSKQFSQESLGLCHSPVETLSLALLFCTVPVSQSLLLIFNGIHYPQWREKDAVHWFLLVLWRICLNTCGDHIQNHELLNFSYFSALGGDLNWQRSDTQSSSLQTDHLQRNHLDVAFILTLSVSNLSGRLPFLLVLTS